MKNANAVAKDWAARLGASGTKIKEGVLSVTTAPTEAALRQVDQYVAGVQRAVTDGRYQAGLRSVSLQDWQQDMVTKGLPRIGQGAQAAIPKMESFLTKFLPHVDAGKQKLANMPRGSIDQNIARMVEMVRHNASFRNK